MSTISTPSGITREGQCLLFPRDTDRHREGLCVPRAIGVGSCAITIERRLMARRPFQFFDGVEGPAASGI